MKKLLFIFMFVFVVSCAKNDVKSNVAFLQSLDLKKVSIIVGNINGEKKVIESDNDRKEIIKMLSTAEYNKKLNDSGIMIKMAVNDVSLYLSDEKQEVIILLWTNTGSIKVDGKWYNIDKSNSNGLEVIKKIIK